MKFVDYVKIKVVSGKGGRGCVSFRREKYVPRGGPDGGDGGDGGDVIIRVDPQLSTLQDYTYNRLYRARDGRPGEGANKSGKKGESVIIRVPVGTEIHEAESGRLLLDCVETGKDYLLLKGGKGGRGNQHFATPTNRAPRHAEPGKPGQELEIELILKVLADVGLVGLPNAGKSTLLSRLTTARPRIADYPFTTLSPNLGIVKYGNYKSFVLADIPGLIEGAHLGKGLGHYFLRHIERTKVLALLIDITQSEPEKIYKVLLEEMKAYSPQLMNKKRVVAFNKIDLAPDYIPPSLPGEDVICISAVTGENLEKLIALLDEKLSHG